ncbi:hypothetical protein ACFWYW_46825 [Nonomuraea sp. NPDC059023]|uniref:hypothetical protein n=1 Tax=unclassified Nonomuraea TaxID=2593643 RepID=UPI0036AB4E66
MAHADPLTCAARRDRARLQTLRFWLTLRRILDPYRGDLAHDLRNMEGSSP